MNLIASGLGVTSWSTIVSSVIVSLVTWYLVSAVLAWYRLRHIPGPWLASFSYLWIGLNTLRGKNAQAYLSLEKYGRLVRNGPNYLVTDDPETLRAIAGSRAKYTRDSWNTAAKFGKLDSMASLISTKAHDAIKAKVASGYNGRENPDLEPAIDSQICRLIHLIRRKFTSNGENFRPVDFSLISRYFTLDVITRLGYGQPFGYLDEGTDVYGWISQIDLVIGLNSVAFDVPWIRRIFYFQPIMHLLGPKATDKTGIGKIMSVTQRLISERLEDEEPRNDMVGGFIRNGLTRPELQAEVMLQIFAGSDTAACTIRGTMLYVITTPRVYNRLKEEIKEAVEGKVSYPISHREALKLSYLQAVIWEGYRMKPPVNAGHYKVTPPGGDTINGVFVPGGTAIGHNTVALTRNKSIFGPDAHLFRPERFLECTEHQKLQMNRALDITFGAGRWMCAGKTIATMELNKIFFELLRAFDFQIVDPTCPWNEASYLVTTHKSMWMTIAEATS
ncbi:cytochrome P450 [Thozetella sp. PMI_491]|nr:cytochrome P450 [Thozetella sp. PMI_491]